MKLLDYVSDLQQYVPSTNDYMPWHIVKDLQRILSQIIPTLGKDFIIKDDVAVHKSANVESHVILKGPIVIYEDCFVGAHAYLRGGVLLAQGASIGPGCEVKTSIILKKTTLAHFNFVGDSLLGSNVNMEAGSVIANHHNDRDDKTIYVRVGSEIIKTDVVKFGALIGDDCKIGANSVCNPGTILSPKSVVKRLELVDQIE